MFSFSFLFLLSQDTIVILILLMEGFLADTSGLFMVQVDNASSAGGKSLKRFFSGGLFFFYPLTKVTP